MKEQKIIVIILHGLGAIPAGGLIATFLLWLFKKDEFYEVETEGRKALNFQITFFVVEALTSIFSNRVAYGIHIFVIIFSLLAAYKMFQDEEFEYPYSYKLF